MDELMFVAKKVLSLAIMPIPLTVILVLLGLYFMGGRGDFGKAMVFFAVMVLAGLSQPDIARQLSTPLEEKYVINHQPIEDECVVMVLGSTHTDNQAATVQQQLSDTANARLLEGVRQYKMGENCQFVVSGYNGGYLLDPHAQVMGKAAVELGIPADNIVTLDEPKDTIEEAQALYSALGPSKIRLVTSATHMPRAVMIFEALGMEVEPAPADFRALDGMWWRPSADHLLTSQRAVTEYVGILWLRVRPNIEQPEGPTRVAEPLEQPEADIAVAQGG
ncbi:YdcF family protein [Paraferrimonas sedimenticola]|uniref:DUF218 domain-containing protein n=1 Tax=Paraferrimonas sedimenticola TaxID=375674 RepID=A0AA37RWC3_9GAMM|nr:ElyC/SanA/YdcF family protein [Paraferrimonas sedimenticola]GLP96559.1 hypothetical protein GCM10007895_18650 [Paraferrimonas sedimenticola]